MSDFYKQSVSDGNQVQYKSVKALAFMCFGLAVLMILLGDLIPAGVIAIAGIAALYFKKYLLESFDYEMSDGKVFIEKIIANKDRKKVFEFNVSDIIIMAPEASKRIKELDLKTDKTLKLYPKVYLKGIYSVIVKSGVETYKIKIVPDKKILDLCHELNKTNVMEE